MLNFINKSHGMELEPIPSFWQKRGNENGILFLVVYYLLKYEKDLLTEEDIHIFERIILFLQTWSEERNKQLPGLYDRGAFESYPFHIFYEKDRRKISHDNITAISRFSKLVGLPFSKDIAEFGLDNQFRFDNQNPDSPKWKNMQFHPRDWFFWLYNGDWFTKSLSWLFFPIFFFANIISCMSPERETSGKQLMFVRLFKQKNWLLRFNFWICNKILIKKYNTNKWLSKIVDIYYWQCEDNPIRILAKDIEF